MPFGFRDLSVKREILRYACKTAPLRMTPIKTAPLPASAMRISDASPSIVASQIGYNDFQGAAYVFGP